jgi:predicted nucleotidyltransferase
VPPLARTADIRQIPPIGRGSSRKGLRGTEAVYNEIEAFMNLQQRRTEILQIAASHGARNLRVFGSVARGDDGVESDLDLLVDMEPERSFLDIVGLSQALEELLERRVDVLTNASLHPAIRDRILAESRPL